MLGNVDQKFFTVKDIPAADFIRAYADFLKKNNKLDRPQWVDLVKTSKSHQLAPLDDDWLYIRVASLARKIYVRPRTGVKLLTHIYGSKKQVGCKRPHHETAGGKIIRWSLQQLEKLKVIKKGRKTDELKVNSRVISKDGAKDLNRIATEVALAGKGKTNV